MQRIRFRLGGGQTPLGELTALPRPSSWIEWVLLLRKGEGGQGREERGEAGGKGKERKGVGTSWLFLGGGWTPWNLAATVISKSWRLWLLVCNLFIISARIHVDAGDAIISDVHP